MRIFSAASYGINALALEVTDLVNVDFVGARSGSLGGRKGTPQFIVLKSKSFTIIAKCTKYVVSFGTESIFSSSFF